MKIFFIHPLYLDLDLDLLKQYLHPQEVEYANTIKSKLRQKEFIQSRIIFHKLTNDLNPLLNKVDGIPLWPKSFCGSITHKDGISFVAIVPKNKGNIGIDAELVSKLKKEIASKICTVYELTNFINKSSGLNIQLILTLIFSIKEAVFKAYYPLIKRVFYFQDVQITKIDFNKFKFEGVLTVRHSKKLYKKNFCGNFTSLSIKHKKFIISSLIVPSR